MMQHGHALDNTLNVELVVTLRSISDWKPHWTVVDSDLDFIQTRQMLDSLQIPGYSTWSIQEAAMHPGGPQCTKFDKWSKNFGEMPHRWTV